MPPVADAPLQFTARDTFGSNHLPYEQSAFLKIKILKKGGVVKLLSGGVSSITAALVSIAGWPC